MNSTNMSKQTNTLLGLVAGVVVGSALGVLFAPKSGKETRNELSEKAKDLAAKAEATRKELSEKLSEVSAQEQERIKGYIAQLDAYIKDMIGTTSNSSSETTSVMDEENGHGA